MAMNRKKSTAGSRKRPERLTYRGHKIELLERPEPDMPTLSIDGAEVMVWREETGGYSAPMLNMFAIYPSLADLARSLIELSPVFLAEPKE
jgi:hypothetical protein